MKSPPDNPIPSAITRAASDWIARCDRGLTPAEAEAFARWENADPRHVAELTRLSATWNALNTADEIPEVMRLARELEERPRPTWHARYRVVIAVGSGLAAALAIAFWVAKPKPAPTPNAPSVATVGAPSSYKVVASTARRLTLADGTVVELNGDSAVEPAFTADRRLVRLVRGEANFTVVPEPGRPFVVQAGNVAVEAVGTAFNVRLDPAAVAVLVTEGRVRVDDAVDGRSLLNVEMNRAPMNPGDAHAADTVPGVPLLIAGERVVIPVANAAPVVPSEVTSVDLDRATNWQATQLFFERTSLAEAVAAFNSFNRQQLVLADPALGNRKLGGSFRADHVEVFVRLLEAGFEIKAETNGDRIVLRAAR